MLLRRLKHRMKRLSKNKLLKSELKKNEVEISSFKKQIEKLRGGLKGISDEDKKIIARAKYYTNEKNRFDEVELEYSTVLSNIQTLKNAVENYKNEEPNADLVYENCSIIDMLNSERADYLNRLSEKLDNISEEHLAFKGKVDNIRNDWKLIRDEFRKKYLEAKEKSSSSKTTLASIRELEDKIEKLELIVRQKESTDF